METSTTGSGRSGRRRGEPHTREAIAEAARLQFAESGYEGATMRSIALAAGVDPALIVHFFGNKEALFREVMELPEDLDRVLQSVGAGPRESAGERFAQAVVRAMDNPATRSIIIGRIRSAATHEEAAGLVRDLVSKDLGVITRSVANDQPAERAVLVGVQVVGLVVARYVAAIEPLASMPSAEVARLMAPIFQRLLVEPLGD